MPTVLDRFIQQAALQVLQAQWDGTFSASSYGFRPGRSAHQAVSAAQALIASGRRVVVDLDIEKFFDRGDHGLRDGFGSSRLPFFLRRPNDAGPTRRRAVRRPPSRFARRSGDKCTQIVGVAAGDKPAVNDGLLVDPVRACVLDILADRLERRHLAALDGVDLNEEPGAVAHGGDKLVAVDEGPDDAHCLGVDPQLVRIDDAAGDHEHVVSVELGVRNLEVRRQGLAPVGEIPSADGSAGRRRDLDPRALLAQFVEQLEQLELLDAVGADDEDSGVLNLLHGEAP